MGKRVGHKKRVMQYLSVNNITVCGVKQIAASMKLPISVTRSVFQNLTKTGILNPTLKKSGHGTPQVYQVDRGKLHTSPETSTTESLDVKFDWNTIRSTFNDWYAQWEESERKYKELDTAFTDLRARYTNDISALKTTVAEKEEIIKKTHKVLHEQEQEIVQLNKNLKASTKLNSGDNLSFKKDPMKRMFTDIRTRPFNKSGS